MPLYDYKCNACDNTYQKLSKISSRNDKKICDACGSDDSQLVQLGSPSIGDPVRLGIRKVDDGFREVLSKVHEKTYGSNLNTKLSR
jgi:putative FmdB family regulatory protein